MIDYASASDELSLEAGIRVALSCVKSATTRESKRAAFRLAAELAARRQEVNGTRPELGALPGRAAEGASDRSLALGATRYHTLDNGSITGCRS